MWEYQIRVYYFLLGLKTISQQLKKTYLLHSFNLINERKLNLFTIVSTLITSQKETELYTWLNRSSAQKSWLELRDLEFESWCPPPLHFPPGSNTRCIRDRQRDKFETKWNWHKNLFSRLEFLTWSRVCLYPNFGMKLTWN